MNRNIPLVTPRWIESAIRNRLLHSPDRYSADPKKFCSGLVVSTYQIPAKDREAIFGGVEATGGQWRAKLEQDVTHLVVLPPPPEGDPVKEAVINNALERNVTVILPHYFDDCFRIGRRCSEKSYTFPDPALLRLDPTDLVSVKMMAAEPRTSMKHAGINGPFLSGQVFYLERDLNISPSDRAGYVRSLREAGATVVGNYSDTVTCAVLAKRSGYVYIKAEMDDKLVGSLRWLKDTLSTRELRPPTRKLLHYPPPADPPPEMKNFVIALTNYVSPAREDIEEMVLHLGAKFTKSMSHENTHLICAWPSGEKYKRASQWGTINIINHLWLEDIYHRWVYQREAKPAYVCFPTNLGCIVGQTPVSPEEVEKSIEKAQASLTTNSGIGDDGVVDLTAASPLKKHGSHRAETPAFKPRMTLADSTLAAAEATVGSAIPLRTPADKPRRSSSGITPLQPSTSGISVPSSARTSANATPAKATKGRKTLATSSPTSSELMRPPSSDPLGPASSPSKRGRGSGRGLVEVVPPLRKSTRVPGPSSSPQTAQKAGTAGPSSTTAKKRPRLSEAGAEDQRVSPSAKGRAKRRKLDEDSDKDEKILLFTGLKPSPADLKGIKTLGGCVGETVQHSTHLIAVKIARTEKFLTCLSSVRYIVHKSWLDASIAEGHWVDEKDHFLKDPDIEAKYDFSLAEAMARAKQRKLLEGWTVYATPNVQPDAETMKRIVESAGGRTKTQLHPKVPQRALKDILSDQSPNKVNPNRLIVLSCAQDKAYQHVFVQHGIKIYSSELLLTGLLRQELSLGDPAFMLD
ncbi:hypothetical protein HK104_007453 [Borealophlyctis nickersoniae]|nr:hypothetical protein HK104_007453 [Borealophlyctis nickersoniae]